MMWTEVSLKKGILHFLWPVTCKAKRIAAYLLSIGANKFAQNDDGYTAFHRSCMHGNQALAAWLLGKA